jgi:type I restriction enzyme R subunit
VRKRDYFNKYGDQAHAVLSALLDKYADSGVEVLEDIRVLRNEPLTDFGTPIEILNLFGGKSQFEMALRGLETELYRAA